MVKAIQNILKYSAGETIQVDGAEVKGKQRKFLETVELQISEYTRLAAAAAAPYKPRLLWRFNHVGVKTATPSYFVD